MNESIKRDFRIVVCHDWLAFRGTKEARHSTACLRYLWRTGTPVDRASIAALCCPRFSPMERDSIWGRIMTREYERLNNAKG